MSILFIAIALGTVTMIEFYYAKDADRIPILSKKNEDVAKQYTKYSSIFYNVYKCYNKSTFVVSKKENITCPRIAYYIDNYYTNSKGLKILKKDYQMIYGISKTSLEIENFTTQDEVNEAVFIAENYQKLFYKLNNNIAIFREFVVTNEYGDYDWRYQDDDPKYHKCYYNDKFKEYTNNGCIGEWKELELSNEWCSYAKSNTVPNIITTYNKYCK